MPDRRRWSAPSLSRRRMMGAGLAAGGALTLAACGSQDDSNRYRRGPVEVDYSNGDNPFGVDGRAPLDLVLFMGGFGDEYATEGHQPMYQDKYPKSHVMTASVEQIAETVRPRMDNFKPPDVLMNAGGERFEPGKLMRDGQVLDLNLLFDAPSYDDPSVTVRETLRDGVEDVGKLGGDDGVWGLPYAYTGYGLWYSQKLFDDNNWELPTSWDGFLELCAEIKSSGIAPMAVQGRYPFYMLDPIVNLAVRHGGVEVSDGMLQDFSPDAFRHDSLEAALESWEEFVSKGYIMEGSHKLDHLTAQAEWAKGEAAFVPCGSWLENEQKDDIPSDFDMAFLPVPALSGSAAPDRVMATAQDHFVVPKYANNPAGGLEYLRMMLSKEGSQIWTEYTASLNASAAASVVADLPGVKSLESYMDQEDNLYANHFESVHADFCESVLYPAIEDFIQGDIKTKKFIDEVSSQAG